MNTIYFSETMKKIKIKITYFPHDSRLCIYNLNKLFRLFYERLLICDFRDGCCSRRVVNLFDRFTYDSIYFIIYFFLTFRYRGYTEHFQHILRGRWIYYIAYTELEISIKHTCNILIVLCVNNIDKNFVLSIFHLLNVYLEIKLRLNINQYFVYKFRRFYRNN